MKLRLTASIRYPLVLAVLGAFWLASDMRMKEIAAGLDRGLHNISRLEEASRLENEMTHFYTSARKLAEGDSSVTTSSVGLNLDLMWARAVSLNSESYAAVVNQSPERTVVPELVEALPRFEAATRGLVAGKPESYTALEALEMDFAARISDFADWAYRERRKATNVATSRDFTTLQQVRSVQAEYKIIVGMAIVYIMIELLLYWRSNQRLSRLVAEKRDAMRTDYLTGIANRMWFEEALVERSQGAQASVVFFDLDGFKKINDTHGHSVGDKLLARMADVLRSHSEPSDVVARFGGDEFAALIETDRCVAFVEAVIRDTSGGFLIDGSRINITTSAGICHLAESGVGNSPQDMIRNADLALYAAKRLGKNRYLVFSAELLKHNDRKVTLEADIAEAIRLGLIDVAYQPIMRTSDRKIAIIETLVRWNHPTLGYIPPLEICDVARSTGQMMELTLYILESACRFRASLNFVDREFQVSINVSPELLTRADIAGRFFALAQKWSVDTRRIVLEVTEQSAEMEGDDRVVQSIAELHGFGFCLAVDDFGAGQSNLVRLSGMDFSILKLDKSLIDYIDASPKDVKIVGAITRLAADIGIQTVAEGVETMYQLRILEQAGADYMQGYLISRPLSPSATLQFLIETLEGVSLSVSAVEPATDTVTAIRSS